MNLRGVERNLKAGDMGLRGAEMNLKAREMNHWPEDGQFRFIFVRSVQK